MDDQPDPSSRVSLRVGANDLCFGWEEQLRTSQSLIFCPQEKKCGHSGARQPTLKKRGFTGTMEEGEPPSNKVRAGGVGSATPSFKLRTSSTDSHMLDPSSSGFHFFNSTGAQKMRGDIKFNAISESVSSLDDEPVWNDISDIDDMEESTPVAKQLLAWTRPLTPTRQVSADENDDSNDLPDGLFGWFTGDVQDNQEIFHSPADVSTISSGNSSHKLNAGEELIKTSFLQDRPNKPASLKGNVRPSVARFMNVMGDIDTAAMDLDGPVFEDDIFDPTLVSSTSSAMLDSPLSTSPFPQTEYFIGEHQMSSTPLPPTTFNLLPYTSPSLLIPTLKTTKSVVTPERPQLSYEVLAIDLLADVADASVELEETSKDGVSYDSSSDNVMMTPHHSSESKGKKSEASWRKKLDQLRDYARENGHCNVPQKYPKDPSLGRWVARQRLFLRQCLDEEKVLADTDIPSSHFDINEKVRLLSTVGLTASPRKMGSGKNVLSVFLSSRHSKEWDNRFAELLRYKSIHGDCDVPVKSDGDFKSLGRWVTSQRKKYKEFHSGEYGEDSPDDFLTRFRRLEEVGFKFVIGSGRGKSKQE